MSSLSEKHIAHINVSASFFPSSPSSCSASPKSDISSLPSTPDSVSSNVRRSSETGLCAGSDIAPSSSFCSESSYMFSDRDDDSWCLEEERSGENYSDFEERQHFDDNEDEDEEECSTPRSTESRIPKVEFCPPAPRKRRPTLRVPAHARLGLLIVPDFDDVFFPARCSKLTKVSANDITSTAMELWRPK